MSKIFFHVDVNSAFLSWSAIKHLRDGEDVDLRTIPAVVGGDEAQRHGVVLAKSGPAKKYGIKTGESLLCAPAPSTRASRWCRRTSTFTCRRARR